MTPHLGQSGASTRGAAQRGHPALDIEPLYRRSGTTLQARTCADPRRSPTAALWCLSPSLVDGDVKMFESAAIVAYLGDKYADKKLAPPVGAPERAAYYQWLFFGMTTLEEPVGLYAQHTSSLPPEKRVAHVAEDAKGAADRALAAVETS